MAHSLTEAHSAEKMEIIAVALLLVAVGQAFTKPLPKDETERDTWLLAEVREIFLKISNAVVQFI